MNSRLWKKNSMQGFKGEGSGQRSRAVPMEELSDETLIKAIAIGAVWALEELYERHHRLLYSVAYRVVADHQVAEDLLQETFMAVWRSAGTYVSQAGVGRSWLVSIIRHRAIDHLRRLRARAALKDQTLDELINNEELATPDAWEEAWRSLRGAQVRQALGTLSNEQRLVIELAYFQGWTHSEIAKGYQIPLGTVKARMRLGLLRLRHLLEQTDAGER